MYVGAWSSGSIVLWLCLWLLPESNRGSAQARPKQALHDTSFNNWGEPNTRMSIEIFRLLYTYICRTSFRIYLCSISTICNISSMTRMRTQRRGHGREYYELWRKRARKLCDIRDRGTKKRRKTKKRQKQILEISKGELQRLRLRGARLVSCPASLSHAEKESGETRIQFWFHAADLTASNQIAEWCHVINKRLRCSTVHFALY